jgi:hypothetical protein
LAAYQTALRFLDDWQHGAGLSSSSRHFVLVRKAGSSLATDAFSCSARCGAFTTTVELVEQGRAVFWTQLAHFRTPLDDISVSSDIGKALAAEFKQISLRLHIILEVSSEDRSALARQLTTQRDDVISRIRALPNFSRFLLPPLFSDLRSAAEDGPIIIVNASKYSCDALIVARSQDPIHLPLDITQAEVSELSMEFQSLTGDVGSSKGHLEFNVIVDVLRSLWERVVGPIVTALRCIPSLARGSRIWWCPTAEFVLLPLHAAGPYQEKRHNLSHYFISSYTPTLAALIRAREHHRTTQYVDTPHFVAIGQARPNEGKELPRVTAELGDVAQRITPILPFTSVADSDATVERAADAISGFTLPAMECRIDRNHSSLPSQCATDH